MAAVAEKIKVPELRFPSFAGGWEEKRLGEIGNTRSGLTYSPTDVVDDASGIMVARSSNIQEGLACFEDCVFVDLDIPHSSILRKGDILICVRNGSRKLIGKKLLVRDRLINKAFGAFMSVFESEYNDFVNHLLDSSTFKKQIHQNLGATINQITTKNLLEFQFWFPSVSEQGKIAEFLTAVDEKIAKLKRKKELLEEYKRGMMQKLFSQEIRFKDEDGNDFPEWDMGRLSKLTSIKITDGPHLTPRFHSDGIPFLSVNNLVENKLDFSNPRRISKADHLEFSKKCKPQYGDILLGKAASVGKVGFVDVDIEFNIWSPLACIRMKEDFNSKFFFYAFQTHSIQRSIWRLVNASSQPNIGMGDIGKLVFSFPSRSEQDEIARALSLVDAKIVSASKSIEKAQEFKRGLLQKMFV